MERKLQRFKAGQIVRRTGGHVCAGGVELRTGDVATVAECFDDTVITLKGYGTFKFDAARFEPVAAAQAAPAGRKDDSGKLDMNLLDDMPRAIKAVVEVMQWAIAEKRPTPYERGSWLGVHADRYRAAVKRHDRDACQQSKEYGQARFERDSETKLLHLAHIATSALMALENTIREMEAKNAG